MTSPEGREAFAGSYPSQGEIEIAVRPEEAGRVWQVRIDPGYQASLWLAGDTFPYLSISLDQVLRPAGEAEAKKSYCFRMSSCRSASACR